MSGQVPLYICRYELLIDDEALSPPEHKRILSELSGRAVAYRRADPKNAEKDTFIFKVADLGEVAEESVISWHVGKQLSARIRTRYDKEHDDAIDEMVAADEIQFSRFIALPWRGVCAVIDRSDDRSIPGASAVSRMKAVFRSVPGGEARITPAASSSDIQRAMTSWQIDTFSFTVRPFNPTLRKPGDQMHSLMLSDGIGVMTATAKPLKNSEGMRDSDHGLMAEARGLSDHGYGQYGFTGHTPEGRKVSLPKPKFSEKKEDNLREQREMRRLKLYVDEKESQDAQILEVVMALKEFLVAGKAQDGAPGDV